MAFLATAQTATAVLPRVVTPPHPWQTAAPIARGPEAYFTNLKDGQTIETPFLVKFGLSGGWGLAPIAKPMGGKSGHHHLLINRDLPLDFKKALPFDDQYIHFGKGQMEKVLDLPPGTYTLRMLLADDQHLPHFVYSEPTKITVSKKNNTGAETLVKKGVSLQIDSLVDKENNRNGAEMLEVSTAFRVQMHASGLNVAHQAQQEAGTGYFKLSFFPKSGVAAKPVAEMEFFNGETEVWLLPPAGDYQIRVDLMDNTAAGKVLAESALVPIRVLKGRG